MTTFDTIYQSIIKKIMEEKELPVKKALIRKQRNHFFVGEPLIFRIGIQYNTKSNVQNTAKILVLLLSKKWDQCMILLIQKLELSFDHPTNSFTARAFVPHIPELELCHRGLPGQMETRAQFYPLRRVRDVFPATGGGPH